MKSFTIPLIATIAVITLLSCLDEEKIELELKSEKLEYLVHISEIKDIALNIKLSLSNNKSNASSQIETILEVQNDKGENLYFIINFKNGGFLILAGDKRTAPILAFSERGSLNMAHDDIPSGLIEWLNGAKNYINAIKDRHEPLKTEMLSQWEISKITHHVSSLEKKPANNNSKSYGDCEAENRMKGPLLETNWGQGVGYNNLAPHLNCNNYTNGRAPAGCVATATAQVMKHHQYPLNYNWSIMPNNTGSNETSKLMKDIADAVNMKWGCNSSSANTGNASHALKNNFGYSRADYGDFEYATVVQQIDENKPVILRGADCNPSWIFFEKCKNGHAWVSDGYKYLIFSPHCWWLNRDFAYSELHMNWGWNSSYNGWYDYRFWNPANYNFSDKKKMIYNIKP